MPPPTPPTTDELLRANDRNIDFILREVAGVSVRKRKRVGYMLRSSARRVFVHQNITPMEDEDYDSYDPPE